MAQIGFLGTGEIAAAMVRTIARDGHRITVSRRSQAVSAQLAQDYPGLRRAENQAVLDDSDIVVLSLLADTAREVLPGLRFRAGQTVISVMARMPLAELARLCAPASDICIAIPLPPLPLGGTPLAAFPGNARLREIFGPHAQIHPCRSEDEIAAHFAATGALLPLLDQIDVAAGWLAGFTGDQAGAASYLAGLVGGYCRLLTQEGAPDLAQLRAGLGTEGGLNQRLSQALRDSGAPKALRDGLDGLRPGLGLPPGS